MCFVKVGFSQESSIISGIPWFDNNGDVVSAHGVGIIREDNRFYLFGELKSDTSNAFAGFSCYSSENLVDWKFENIVLPVHDSGRLGCNRVGERPKVLKCQKTGMFVMFMHTDNLKYKDQCIGFATCDKINGNYKFRGPLLFNGKSVRFWDMGVFQDSDGTGYVITHSGNLFKLSDDYTCITEQTVKNMTSACEAPVIFKKDSIYYWLGSGLSGWERNDNYYFTATNIHGPWTRKGLFAPKGSLTWNSQTTSVFPVIGIKDTTFVFMGDRWSYPKQRSAATYIWQPLEITGDSISLPDFKQAWNLNISDGIWHNVNVAGKIIENTNKSISYSGKWQFNDSICRSEENGASFSYTFNGEKIGFYGTASNDCGYALVVLKDSENRTVFSRTIDMYCKYPETSLKFVSPKLKKGTYTLVVSVVGEHWAWVEKSGRKSGSRGNFVSLNSILVKE